MEDWENLFWAKVDKSGDCWLWTAAQYHNGYGAFSIPGVGVRRAHRIAYALLVGPIGEGMQVDHTCHVRQCVRPEHLRQVSGKQNQENRKGANAGNRSGVRGVSWDKRLEKWHVQVTHNHKNHHLGHFDSLEAASGVAKAKRLELFTHSSVDLDER